LRDASVSGIPSGESSASTSLARHLRFRLSQALDHFPKTPSRLRVTLFSLASKALHPPNRSSVVSRRHLRLFDPV